MIISLNYPIWTLEVANKHYPSLYSKENCNFKTTDSKTNKSDQAYSAIKTISATSPENWDLLERKSKAQIDVKTIISIFKLTYCPTQYLWQPSKFYSRGVCVILLILYPTPLIKLQLALEVEGRFWGNIMGEKGISFLNTPFSVPIPLSSEQPCGAGQKLTGDLNHRYSFCFKNWATVSQTGLSKKGTPRAGGHRRKGPISSPSPLQNL